MRIRLALYRQRSISEMKFLKNALVSAARPYLLGCSLAALTLPLLAGAQDLTNRDLLDPQPDMWPSYHGDYTGERHSHLTQITPDNVGYLSLSWVFQTGQTAQIKSTPVLIDGVLYFTVPD